MGDRHADRYSLLFTDTDLQEALSSIGVFASDYQNNRNFASELWTAQGFTPEELGQSLGWTEKIHPQDRRRVEAAAKRVFAGQSLRFDETFRLRRRNGTYRWVVSRGSVVAQDDAGKPVLYVGVDTDISRIKTVEKRLERQNDELETLRQIAAVIGASLDMEETVSRILEQTRRIIPYDTATVQLLEDGRLRVIGGAGFDDLGAVMRLRFRYPEPGSLSTRALDYRRPIVSRDVCEDFPTFVQLDQEHPIRSWIGIPLIRRDEVIGLMAADSRRVGVYDDSHLKLAATVADHIAIALENARLHDQTYQMAMSDALTGAGSRRRFQIEGRLLYENAQRNRRSIAAAMIDIDLFKAVNDQHGHKVGDRVLQRIAQACTRELRGADLLARYGGEEFVLLLPEADNTDGWAAAERIRRRIERISHTEVGWPVTVSIGVAWEIPENSSGFDTLIHRADSALYRAKEQGRNRVVVEDPR